MVRGLVQVTSFTYFFYYNSGVLTEAQAVVIDGWTNTVVALVDITTLMPTTYHPTAMTATFASAVALNPLHNYLLAMCILGDDTLSYRCDYNYAAVCAFFICFSPYADCQKGNCV
jgi:hypothetical protein